MPRIGAFHRLPAMEPTSDARRLCLITGASAGIGAAFARLYAERGYDLALTARRGDRLKALAEEIELRSGAEILCIEADLAEKDATDAILGEIERADYNVFAGRVRTKVNQKVALSIKALAGVYE